MEIYPLKRLLLLFAFCILSSALRAATPDGYIVKVDSATVYLDWGKTSGVAPGDPFKMYRAGEPLKHPVTGEILGQTEIDLGQGVVDRLEDKYSTGKMVDIHGDLKAGDRTRYVESAVPVPAVSTAPAIVIPKEIWRSESLKSEASGLALGDVIGDGKKEVVVAFRDHVEVFQWSGQKLESLAVFKDHGYSNYLSVETGDIDGAGHDKIFATLYIEGVKRSRTVVLEYAEGELKEVGHVEGFVRAVMHADGKRELLWQGLSLARELHVQPPAPLIKDGKAYRDGHALKFSHPFDNNQLFGFTWGDWDGDGSEDLALLQDGERLQIFFKDTKWTSSEVYGGGRTDFSWENNTLGSLYPRLVNWKTSAGTLQLLVPHNIPMAPLHLVSFENLQGRRHCGPRLEWDGDGARLDAAPVGGTGGLRHRRCDAEVFTAIVGGGYRHRL